MKNILIKTGLLALALSPTLLMAQAPGFGGGGVTDTPIDGGISLLVAAGVGYGVKKVAAKRKAKNETIEQPKKK